MLLLWQVHWIWLSSEVSNAQSDEQTPASTVHHDLCYDWASNYC